jgi:hypothetical protein
MTPNEERVLKIALDAYDDDLAEVAVAVLQDELIEQWERRRGFVDFHRILQLVPWRLPYEHMWTTTGENAIDRPTESAVFKKRRWMAQTIAAYLLFRDWPRRWPLVERCRTSAPEEFC